MKWTNKLKGRLTGLTNAIARFPLTTLSLLVAAFINAYGISSEKDVSELLLTFVVGAFLSATLQVAYERYFSKLTARLSLMGAVVLLTSGYYLIIREASQLSMEIEIRTAVALFALLIAFILVPVIKSKISFNKSFMITFKSLFNSLFFSGVIFAGIAIILGAFNILIFEIDYTAYPHSANIIFVIFAPMYFLSLIPIFPGTSSQQQTDRQQETIEKVAYCPKFLEILISYILIPLIAVFTLILVLYILKNIGGEFWTDNLLEPMLVSYAITVILVYILASEIENKFTLLFRKIFPKVLVPIVLFQIVSSFLTLGDTGVTHTRYYVILFGIFAAVAGVLLSFLPVRKNGIIAALLIVFAVVSIVPPVDAFTVSRESQINLLQEVLQKNNMLENNNIKPNASISAEDKQTISNAVQYLSRMDYTKKVDLLPDDFDVYRDFEDTFGFSQYDHGPGVPDIKPIYLVVDQSSPINITGFDALIRVEINLKYDAEGTFEIVKDGEAYTLMKEVQDGQIIFKLVGEDNQELITFNTKQIYDRYNDYTAVGKDTISIEEATFTEENEKAKMTVVIQHVSVEKGNEQYNNAGLYVLVAIK